MTVRLGINPLTWSNDDLPALGAENSLETCLTRGARSGLRGRRARQQVSAACRQAAPDPAGARPGARVRLVQRPPARARCRCGVDGDARAFRVAAGAGLQGHGVRGSEPLHSRRSARADFAAPVPAQRRMAALRQRLTALAERMQREGLRMAYHHHMGTVVQSADGHRQLMTNTGDAVGLLLDTGHLTYAGGDPAQAAARYAKRIVHVHCKDVRREVLERCRNRDSSFLDAVLEGVFTVPGDGMVDYRSVLRADRAQRLSRLAGRRSRAGPGRRAAAAVCAAGVQKSLDAELQSCSCRSDSVRQYAAAFSPSALQHILPRDVFEVLALRRHQVAAVLHHQQARADSRRPSGALTTSRPSVSDEPSMPSVSFATTWNLPTKACGASRRYTA